MWKLTNAWFASLEKLQPSQSVGKTPPDRRSLEENPQQ